MRSMLLLAGVLLALWTPAALQGAATVAVVVAALLLLCVPRARCAWIFALGFLHAQHAALLVLQPAIDCSERLLVEARIESVPAAVDSGWQFDAQVVFPRQPRRAAQRVRISAPRSRVVPHAGERWQYAVQFAAVSAGAQGAVRRRNLLRDHVSSVARVIVSPLNRRLGATSAPLDSLRERVAARIDARVADPAAAALLAALAVGATGDVTRQQWRVFSATGITHLVAISGMHVTFFALLSMACARYLWRRWPAAQCRIRREAFAALIGVTLALGYALLSGFSVPAQRTVAMLVAFLAVRECARITRPAWSVGASLAAVLLFDPLAVLSAGFWLSFMAVACIVLLAGARLWPPAPLRGAVLVQGVVTVALLPVTVAIFGTFSAIGPLVNAVAIPVFTFLLVPPVLLATASYLLPGALAHWAADQLVDAAAWVAGALWPLLAHSADMAGALWPAQVPASWYGLAVPAVVLVLLPVSWWLRLTACAVLFSAFLVRAPRPPAGELWVDVLDGASPAFILRTRHRLLLFGTGESFGSAGRRFESQLLPRLRQYGYPAVSLWLPGKLTRDNQAALVAAAAQLPLQQIELPPGSDVPPEAGACRLRAWNWDEVAFQTAVSGSGRGCTLTAVITGQQLVLDPGVTATREPSQLRFRPHLPPWRLSGPAWSPGIWSRSAETAAWLGYHPRPCGK